MEPSVPLGLSLNQGSLAQRLEQLLEDSDPENGQIPFAIDDLSLALGVRLPSDAQTATSSQHGDSTTALRPSEHHVRLPYGRVIFISTTAAAALSCNGAEA